MVVKKKLPSYYIWGTYPKGYSFTALGIQGRLLVSVNAEFLAGRAAWQFGWQAEQSGVATMETLKFLGPVILLIDILSTQSTRGGCDDSGNCASEMPMSK